MEKATDQVVWENPPESARGTQKGQGRWQQKIRPLMEQPGRWARIAEGEAAQVSWGAVSRLRGTGGRPSILPGRWDGRSAKQEDGTYTVWAVYLGPEEP